MSNYVPGHGSASAKLMVIGEAPGATEDVSGIPFSGPSGRIFNAMLEQAGVHRSEVYVTNVVKYRPPGNDLKKLHFIGHTIEEGIPQLREEVRAINPNNILTLGELALRTLTGQTGITNWRGSILRSQWGPKVVPSIHPAHLLYSDDDESEEGGGLKKKGPARQYIQLDFIRAVEESRTSELKLPPRTVEYCTSSLDLYRYLNRYQGKWEVALDIESVSCIPVCIAIAFNSWHAMVVPLMCVGSWKNKIPKGEHVRMLQMLDKFLRDPRIKIIGHNWKYDDEKLVKPWGFPKTDPWCDTMLLSHTLYCEFPRPLSFLTSVHTRQPFYKFEGKEFEIGKHPMEKLFHYNGLDALVDFEVSQKMIAELDEYPGLREFFFGFVMKLHRMYRDMEDEGFVLDTKVRDELWDKYIGWHKKCQEEMEELLGWKINVQSTQQVHKALLQLGLPHRANVKEDTLVSLYANHARGDDQRRGIELVLDDRRCRKTLGTYLLAPPDLDGRMRTVYRIDGTESGRTSTGKQEPPIRLAIKFPGKREVNLGLPFHNITKYGDVGSDIRTMLVADEGEEFLEVDLSQAEPRVVAVLAEDWELLEKFDTPGFDIHRWTAAVCMSIPEHKIDKKTEYGNGIRYVGKTCRNMGNYDAGKHKFMVELQTGAKRFHIKIPPISEWRANQILEAFHEMTPKVREKFHAAIRAELLAAVNIGARPIFRSPQGRMREFFEPYDERLCKEAYSWIPQAVVSDRAKAAGLEIKERAPWIKLVVEAHDNLVARIPKHRRIEAALIMKEAFERPVDFNTPWSTIRRDYKLVIPCEMKVGDNYKDLKDFKLEEAA